MRSFKKITQRHICKPNMADNEAMFIRVSNLYSL